MGKKVIIISSSFRRKSNSAMLAHAFAEGASEAGNEVEEIFLRGEETEFLHRLSVLSAHEALFHEG